MSGTMFVMNAKDGESFTVRGLQLPQPEVTLDNTPMTTEQARELADALYQAVAYAEKLVDGRQIELPGWVTDVTVSQYGDGAWRAWVFGDPYGVNEVTKAIGDGETPVAALNAAVDKAEGWTTFVLEPKEQRS